MYVALSPLFRRLYNLPFSTDIWKFHDNWPWGKTFSLIVSGSL